MWIGHQIETRFKVAATSCHKMKSTYTQIPILTLSGQQEIMPFGDDYAGDGGDDWIVKCEGEYWKCNSEF